MDDLIARLGEDFVFVGDPPPLNRRLRCVECGEQGRNDAAVRPGANRSKFAD